ncbi:penicillin acylase family protein [Nocardioides sp. SR21]|uniref:penicillin acylase family protein n=1 Tax=Nocardioides sp. SR21 TaxID=2919501 RepID=UPI001FAB19C3|nr:penicillin acylase family protein [Nocardioides sp. SR21]
MKLLQRPLIAITSLLLLAPATAAVAASAPAASPRAAATTVQAPAYDVTIKITEHGIPHITSDTFEGMAYGAGWATMSAATCNLMDTLLTARGLRSKYLGADATFQDNVGGSGTNLQWDTLVTDLHDRQVVEKLLANKVTGPTDRAKAMVVAETAAFNRWLTENEITDPACADHEWIKPDITTTDVWYAFYLAQLISSTTRLLPQITSATPPATKAGANPAAKPTLDGWTDFQEQDFGSNATAVGGDDTSTGRGMILGNPHFPWLGRYRFTQMHLTVPGRFNASGGALTGFPAINIGFNRNVAWSHTVSTAYRFTPYQYTTAGTPTSYKTPNGTAELDRRDVQVQVKTDDGVETVTRTLYRTGQGYVLSAPSLFMPWTATNFWAARDANAEHLRAFDTFLSMGMAGSVRDLLKRQDRGGGMPWVNTIAADRKGDIVYADHSVVPNVTDEMANRCMTGAGRLIFSQSGLPGLDGTRATTDCKWGTDKDAQRPGILGPKRLPETFRRDWVMNANDSYWAPNDKVRLTGFPRIIGCEDCERTMRTKVVMAYVRDHLKQGKETPATLASHQHANRVYAAEVARKGGRLDQICAATGETEACQILHDWDGRSDATSSSGAAIFQEFMYLVPKAGLWEVPFDVKKPFTTPNTMSTSQPVVDAMAAAIARVEAKGLDKTYGELHHSGDRGSAGWPLGGGLGDTTGDANAVSSTLGDPVLDPVTRGSSYIQAIAFLDKGGVKARTILTYSQYENPTSPWSDDQTQLFSEEKWVHVPWTANQIEHQLVDTIHLTGN